MTQIVPERPGDAGDAHELRALLARQLDAHADLRERVGSLMGEARHFATKEDVANVKVWALTSVVGAVISLLFALVGHALVSAFFG